MQFWLGGQKYGKIANSAVTTKFWVGGQKYGNHAIANCEWPLMGGSQITFAIIGRWVVKNL